MELIEFDNRVGPADYTPSEVPLGDILKQHHTRYIYRTQAGDFTLRYVGPLDKDRSTIQITRRDPEYLTKLERFNALARVVKGPGATSEIVSELQELADYLEPYLLEIMLSAIVKPELHSVAELKALSEAMSKSEWETLLILLTELTRDGPRGRVDTNLLSMAPRFGIKICDDLTVENMTCQQAAVFAQAMQDQADALSRARSAIE